MRPIDRSLICREILTCMSIDNFSITTAALAGFIAWKILARLLMDSSGGSEATPAAPPDNG
jgi:hypothetical protein